MALYRVTAQVISTRPLKPRGMELVRCAVGAPTFFVEADSAEMTTSVAHRVLCCDHRDTDSRKIELAGTVIRESDREDYLSFKFVQHEKR